MSAIVAAAWRLEDQRVGAVLGREFVRGDRLRAQIIATGRAINAASNAAARASQVAIEVADCGCWLVTYGDGSKVHYSWMAQIIDGLPCAWPRPFATRGA